MEFLFMLFLFFLAHRIWPDKKDPPNGGNDVFIPFEDGRSTSNGNDSPDRDPYFPDGDF